MTPQQQAKLIVFEYLQIVKYMYQAKQSALLAVDKIIKTLEEDIQDINVVGNILLDIIEWWRKVKEEIKTL